MTLRALEEVQQASDFARYTPVVGEGGDQHQVVLFPESILRVPRSDCVASYAAVEYEAELYFKLHQQAVPPPLAIPDIIGASWALEFEQPYTLVTRLPGHNLLQNEVRQFSDSEKTRLGRALGSFAAWYADAVPVDTCRKLMKQTQVKMPDRSDFIAYCSRLALDAYDIDESLADVLIVSEQQLKEYRASGLFNPTITGHDDLRPGNLTFIKHDESFQPYGVFDFGSTRPSTPERELRHAACLGKSVCDAAIETYESLTETTVSQKLVDFWAVAQASTVLANCLVNGHRRGIASGRASMQTLRPDYDWSHAFIEL
jgi:aminoglycoside phosphotransferase (APT) family kinase protein